MAVYQPRFPPPDLHYQASALDILNPRDYRRLLHWAFYFPKALDVYAQDASPAEKSTLRDMVTNLGLLLVSALHLVYHALWFSTIQSSNAPTWFIIVDFALALVAFALTDEVLGRSWKDRAATAKISLTVAAPICAALGLFPTFLLAEAALKLPISLTSGLLIGMALGHSVRFVLPKGRLSYELWPQLALATWLGIVVLALLISLTRPEAQGMASELARWLASTVAFTMSLLSPLDWLLHEDLAEWENPENRKRPRKKRDYTQGDVAIARATLLPTRRVQRLLEAYWKQVDGWVDCVQTAQDLLEWTHQDVAVAHAIQRALLEGEASDQSVQQVAQLSQHLGGEDLPNFWPGYGARQYWFGPKIRQKRIKPLTRKLFLRQPPVETQAQAAVAGFWYLHQQYVEHAAAAFEQAGSSAYAREIQGLVRLSSQIVTSEYLVDQAPLQMPMRPNPPKHPVLRQALEGLTEVAFLGWIAHRASAEHRALATTIAQGKLAAARQVLAQAANEGTLPTEWQFLLNYVNWLSNNLSALEQAGDLRQRRMEPQPNPYVFTQPVYDRVYIGRRLELFHLQTYLTADNIQPVLIYGPAHTGKTSLLLHMQQQQQGADFVRVDLGLVKANIELSSLLRAITTQLQTEFDLPQETSYASLRNPERTFTDQVLEICRNGGGRSFLLALDQGDRLLDEGDPTMLRDLFSLLDGLMRREPHFGVVLLAHHTREELQERLGEPLLARLMVVQVGSLSMDETTVLLRHPAPRFKLYLLDDALEEVAQRTQRQPRALQLMGYHLLADYNQQVVLRTRQSALITLDDVRAVWDKAQFQQQLAL